MGIVPNAYTWCSAVAAIIQLLTIQIISAYDPSHKQSNAQQKFEVKYSYPSPDTSLTTAQQTSSSPISLDLPNILHDPSPALFAASGLLYAASALFFYHLHRDDKHQRLIVCLALGFGIMEPIATASVDAIRVSLPAAATVSLVLSAIGHRIGRSVSSGHIGSREGKSDIVSQQSLAEKKGPT